MNNENILDISWKTIIKISLIIIAFYIIYQIKDILIWFIFALIISILFNPAIDFLQKKRIPRIIGVILVYFVVFGMFSFLIWLVVPIFSYEIKSFLRTFPQYFEIISPTLKGLGFEAFENIESFIKSFGDTLEAMAANIFNVFFVIFGGVLASFFVIAAAMFLSIEEKIIERILILIFPGEYGVSALNAWERSRKKVTEWFKARILACLFVGIASYIAFLLFGIKYPFTLALFAGVLNLIPYIGPLLTAVLLFIIIFPAEMLKALFVLIAFFLIQQVENSILTPILMKKIVDLPPIIVLFSLVIGGKLWGILGLILIIPLIGILFEFTKEFLVARKKKDATIL